MSKNYRQWYAMRKSLQERGKWTHSVPAQEEGEPARKYAKTNAGQDLAQDLDKWPENSPEAEEGTSAKAREDLGMAYAGFSVLAWVRPDSSLLTNVSEEAAERISTQLLRDFCCLLSCRWNFDVTIVQYEGTKYAYGVNTRISASERTIRNAIGDLCNHVDFLRGTPNSSHEQLAEYKTCREKWKVPDQVTESSSYGWDPSGPAETSQLSKKKRF